METAPPPEAFGHVIFCDDIRNEIGNKLTFVGCYFGDMLITSDFPAVIPRFCLAVDYSQQRGKIIMPIKFVVFLPGDPEDKPSIEFGTPQEVNEAVLAQAEARTVALGGSPDFATFAAQVGLGNLPIPEPGVMKVRAIRGEQLIRLGSLRISRAPQAAGK